jgi:hypothetical protein
VSVDSPDSHRQVPIPYHPASDLINPRSDEKRGGTGFSPPEEKTDYLMLEALEFREINDTSHFIGTEHPIHRRFQELNGDVSSDFRQSKFLQNFSTLSG